MGIQNLDDIAKEIEQEQGGKVTQRKRQFALLKVTQPGKSNAQLAKDMGTNPSTAKQAGYQLAHDPKVKALQEKIEAVMNFPINEENLTTDMIAKGLAKEAFEASNSRDRREAYHLLGKSKGMFKEVIEHRDLRADEEFLQELADQLGPDAARKAADELGLDWE